MKLMLGMVTPVKWQGRFIPVAHFPFVIGRDADCHLRAHSPTVAGHQCALLRKQDRVFINEIDHDQATLVNELQVHGELELHDQDRVKVGGLEFTVRCEADSTQPSLQSAPDSAASPEDAAADLLLAMDKEEKSLPAAPVSTSPPDESRKMRPKETTSSQPEPPDTAAAARNLLMKYQKPHSARGRSASSP